MTRKRGSWWLDPQYAKARCTVKTSYDGHRCKNMARGKHRICAMHARISGGAAALDISIWSRAELEQEVLTLRQRVNALRVTLANKQIELNRGRFF